MRRIFATICLVLIAAQSQAGICTSLKESDASRHWFSMPGSRVVINPSLTITTPGGSSVRTSDEGAISSLRMNVAYYVGNQPIRLPTLWAWHPGGRDEIRSSAVLAPSLEFTPDQYPCEFVTASATEDGLRVTLDADHTWGAVDVPVEVDIDRTPWMLIDAKGVDDRWTVKVISDTEKLDIPLTGSGLTNESLLIDLAKGIGWHGHKRFRIRLFPLGKPGDGATFASIRFAGADTFQDQGTDWYPHKMESAATDVHATTSMPDASTIAQRLKVLKSDSGRLTLLGRSPGEVRWNGKALILQADEFKASITINRSAKWLGFFPAWEDWLTGDAKPSASNGIWALELEDVKPGDDIVLTATFDGPARRLSAVEFDAAIAAEHSKWEDLLSKVPEPLDFSLRAIDREGTTISDRRRMYYRAWAFLLANVLPPMPENGYPFPQVAAGKPSLWDEGHPKAKPSAQWESIIGIHYLAFIDPETAWQAFEGMMSLVDEDGSLAGEGLPARHFRTAWGLYTQTAETERLRALYPAMKRFLLWKFEYPHWIHKRLPDPAAKSQGFTVAAILDAGYAMRIADALGMPEEVEFWRKQREAFADNYRSWFWSGGSVFLGYSTTGERTNAGISWALEGLALPMEMLDEARRDALLGLLRHYWDPDRPMIVSGFTKHPTQNELFRGLWQYGLVEKAAVLAESDLRDITRAGEFMEEYVQTEPPGYSGVGPSIFGAALMIDAALWHNGVIIDDGLPILIRTPNARGVHNLMVGGKRLDIVYRSGDRVELRGPALESLALPTGFTQADPLRWTGTLPLGKELALQPISP